MDSPTHILLDQIQTLLIILERPIVQRQLAVVGIILLLNWPFARFLQQLLRRRGWGQYVLPRRPAGSPTSSRAVEMLALPILSLLLSWLGTYLFRGWG